MKPMTLQSQIHTLSGEEVLPAGISVTPQTIDKLLSSRQLSTNPQYEFLSRASIKKDFLAFISTCPYSVIPNVVNAGGFQRQGIKGEDVIFYFEPLITPHLESSRVPEGEKTC